MKWPATIIATLIALGSTASASVLCTHPDEPGLTYTVSGKDGLYTWSDHGIERSWALTCTPQADGATTCHRWDHYGDNGHSVRIFQMHPDGTLIQANAFARLDFSTVQVTPGFTCTRGRSDP